MKSKSTARKRALKIFLFTLVVSVAMVEVCWRLSLPDLKEYAYPIDARESSRVLFFDALLDRDLASDLNYSEETRRKDAKALEALNAPYLEVERKAKAMQERGMSPAVAESYRRSTLATLRIRSAAGWRSLPTLTKKQEDRLASIVARRFGAWSLLAPEVAVRVGLRPDQISSINQSRLSLLRLMYAEERESNRTRMRIEGASDSAIAASDEMRRLSDEYRIHNGNPPPPPEVSRRIDALSTKSARPVPWWGQTFVSSHREGLERHRKAAWNNDTQEAIFASLSSAQRTRWDNLVRG